MPVMLRPSVAFLAAVLLIPNAARGDLWDVAAGVEPLYGTTFSGADKDGLGALGYFNLGLTETLSLSAGGGYARHFIGTGRAFSMATGSVGILYNLDILEIVPFASVRFGYLLKQRDQPGSGLEGLGLSVAIGFDYLFGENFTVGFAAEYLGLLTDLAGFPAYVAFTARVGFRLPH